MTDFKSLGWAAIDWIETFLVHGPGDVQGRPIELDDEFAGFIVRAYELDPVTGDRYVRRAFLSRSKGRSKSGLASFIECFEALGPARFDHWAEPGEVSDWGYEYEPGEPVGRPLTYVEILNVATEEGQAGNTYDAVHYMLNPETCSDALRRRYGYLDVGLTRINLPDSRGFIEPVSASNESKDGGKSTFIVADETHLWIPPQSGKFKLGKMHQTMVRNLLKRREASGWMLETSTMYAQGEGSVAEGTHEYAQSNKGGKKLLFDHRQASMQFNLDDRGERIAALHEAYGPASAWMDLESIADYWDDPQASEAEFRRFWLNQPVPLEEPRDTVFGVSWPACKGDPPHSLPVAAYGLGAALDLEHVAIVAAYEDGDIVHVKPVYHERGASSVLEQMRALQDVKPAPVVVDARGPAAVLIPQLEAAGWEVVPAKSDEVLAACAGIVELGRDRRLRHAAYPELDRAVEAAVQQPVGDRWRWGRKPRKGETVAPDISPLEGASLASWHVTRPTETFVSAYEARGVLTI